MAIPFLNHLDLRSVSELQNAILHKTTSGSATDVRGAIIYDTGTDTIKYYSHPEGGTGAWVSLGSEVFSFKTIAITGTSGQSDIVADATTDTLTLNAGSNVSITTDDSTDTVTIASTDTNTQNTTTLSFVDSSNDIILRNTTGGAGSGNQDININAGTNITLTHTDANNITISSSDTDTNTQNVYDFDVALGTTKLTLTQSGHDGAGTDQVELVGTGSVTVTRNSSSKLTINGTDTNTDTLQSVANSTSSAENFVTFVASATGAQTAGSDSTFVYIPSSETLKVKNLIVSGDTTTANETVKVVENNTLEFEGASGSGADDELKLTTAVLSADRTITLPDATGTVALTSDITGTNSGTNTGDQDLFKRINGDSGSEVAGSTSDSITFHGGTNVTTSVAKTGTDVDVTITATDTNTQLSTAAALIDVSAMAGNNTASFTHGLASKNLIVQMHDTTSGLVVFADVDHTSNNAISITFSQTGTEMVADSIGDIRVVVIDAKNGLTDKTVSYS